MSEQQFEVNKIFIKDLSAEAPNSPEIHQEAWEPEINLNLGNAARQLDEANGLFEVSLTLTVTATVGEKTAYVVEVEQAGIFTLTGFEDEQRGYVIGALIPNILFPYARETISTLSQKLGFPSMLLNPIDFNGLYQQHLQSQANDGESVITEEASESETKH